MSFPVTIGIQTINLSKRFPLGRRFQFLRSRSEESFFTAVHDLSLEIDEGEIFGLVGPNGAGKTTLIKLMSTLLRPSSGSVRICGYDTVEDELTVRRSVGVVSSNERSFYWRLTGMQNLEFFADLYRLRGHETRKWIGELLSFLDLYEHADRPFGTYSTGTKQRFALARGLLNKPRILLMDEPTKGIDPINAAEIIKLIRERLFTFWRPTVLITSHNLREIEQLCHRIAIMNWGELVACGTISELGRLVSTARIYEFWVLRIDTASLLRVVGTLGVSAGFRLISEEEGLVFQVQLPGTGDRLDALLRAITAQGGSIADVKSQQKSLDEIFLSIVDDSRITRAALSEQRLEVV